APPPPAQAAKAAATTGAPFAPRPTQHRGAGWRTTRTAWRRPGWGGVRIDCRVCRERRESLPRRFGGDTSVAAVRVAKDQLVDSLDRDGPDVEDLAEPVDRDGPGPDPGLPQVSPLLRGDRPAAPGDLPLPRRPLPSAALPPLHLR